MTLELNENVSNQYFQKKTVESHVNKSTKDGQKIVFHGEGDQEPRLETEDTTTALDQKDHIFTYAGEYHHVCMTLEMAEIFCGFQKAVYS